MDNHPTVSLPIFSPTLHNCHFRVYSLFRPLASSLQSSPSDDNFASCFVRIRAIRRGLSPALPMLFTHLSHLYLDTWPSYDLGWTLENWGVCLIASLPYPLVSFSSRGAPACFSLFPSHPLSLPLSFFSAHMHIRTNHLIFLTSYWFIPLSIQTCCSLSGSSPRENS